MKIVFFGTGDFAVPALKKLISNRRNIAAVVTQPDSRRGRGMNYMSTPVKAFIEKAAPGVHIFQPEKASGDDFKNDIKAIGADVFVVVDYGQILGKDLLGMARKYCVNLHPSLLPKYRGASPVNRAILMGEKVTGNTVIKMSERMDAGPIILQTECAIGPDENSVDLLGRLSMQGAALLIEALNMIEAGSETLTEQNEKEATYARKLRKEEGLIDWSTSSEDILLKVRAMQPWPGAYTYVEGRMIKLFGVKAIDVPQGAKPGTIVDEHNFIIKTGAGGVIVETLQVEGKSKMSRDEFLRGFRLMKDSVLG